MTQGTVIAVIGSEEPPKHMRCEMIEADFLQDTITLRMRHPYHACAGVFVLVPIDDYEAMEAAATDRDTRTEREGSA